MNNDLNYGYKNACLEALHDIETLEKGLSNPLGYHLGAETKRQINKRKYYCKEKQRINRNLLK